jgi:hypothetical protein
MIKYQPIDKEFDSKGVHFKQLKREGLVCLYELSKSNWLTNSYEVFILKETPETHWPNGTTSPAREIEPSTSLWGDQGWSLTTKEFALKKFNEVLSTIEANKGRVEKRGRHKKS